MEKLAAVLLIVAAVVGIELQYLVNKFLTPEGMFYLGTVHWPSDYFYYLSQFVQGKEHWLFSTMLFTPEKLRPVLVGWQNVLTGRLLMLTGLDVISAYQAAVGIYLALFLYSAYLFIREVFPESGTRRILSFFFFLTSSSFFHIKAAAGKIEWSYFNHWYNQGIPLARFGPRPHHLLAYTLGVTGWLFFVRKKYFLMALAGLLLASISPVAWGLDLLAFFITSLVGEIKNKTKSGSRWKFLLPSAIYFAAGVIPALYVKAVFSVSPYNLSSVWESYQHLKLSPYHLFLGTGLIFIPAVIGINSYRLRAKTAGVFSLVFLALAVFFYLTDISQKFNVSNVGFWPSQVYLVFALLAAEGVIKTAKIFAKFKKQALAVLLVIYLSSIAPTLYLSYREILSPKYRNGYYFIPEDVLDAFNNAEVMSTPEDVFLVLWPYNESFPALTGRKTFFGYELFTINHQEKMTKAFEIIDGKMGEAELGKTLAYYQIKYLVMYSGNNYFKKFPFLKAVYSNPMTIIYKVDL